MCNPVAVGLVAVAASAAATGLQAHGQSVAAKAAEYDAEANAAVSRSAAAQELWDSREELFAHGIDGRRKIGTQEAIAAASNLDLTFGSARGVLADRYRFSAMESLNIGETARRRSVALRNGASAYAAQAGNARIGGRLATAGIAIGGVGQAASAGYSGYRAGQTFFR